MKKIDTSKFYVIAVISNPVRYSTRYELYWRFKAHMEQSGAQVITVELQQGARPFAVTESDDPMAVQYRTYSEIWHKENLINLGVNYLNEYDPNWEYVAWIDADIEFTRKGADGKTDWIEETVHQLQHFMFVQLFSTAIDLDPDGDPLPIPPHKGFAYQYRKGAQFGAGYTFWHPGFCWAARREALEFTGPLMDFAILGAGDHHMALAMIGHADWSMPGGIHPNYKARVMRWQDRCERYIQRDIGYVDGTILHFWHGRKRDRRYVQRWDILTKDNYDPNIDIFHRYDGVLELSDNNPQLRDDIRTYFRQRNEDSIDLEDEYKAKK